METLSLRNLVKGSDPFTVLLAVVIALTVSACAVRAPYKAPTVAPTTMKNAVAAGRL